MTVYYNEIDKFCCEWLQNLMDAGQIQHGHIDDRSIEDVTAADVRGYRQCHWFAGLGGWPLALRYAGAPDDWPVWTASCPCQPFSAAGSAGVEGDERHLWPALYDIYKDSGLPTMFGEQVASADGRSWFAAVRSDLDLLGCTVGGTDLCAAGIGAPHIRQRIYWVAYAGDEGQQEHAEPDLQPKQPRQPAQRRSDPAGCRNPVGMADTEHLRAGSRVKVVEGQPGLWGDRPPDDGEGGSGVADPDGADVRTAGHPADDAAAGGTEGEGVQRQRVRPDAGSGSGGVGDPQPEGLQGLRGDEFRIDQPGRFGTQAAGSAAPADIWSSLYPIPCSDGRIRFTRPGLSPLAHGIPRTVVPSLAGVASVDIRAAKTNRVGRLRAYGNAICPQLAAEFILAAREAADM